MTSTRTPWTRWIVVASVVAMFGSSAAADQVAESPSSADHESPDESAIQAVARVSDRFVNLIVERRVARQEFMQEYLLGAFTSGPVLLDGTVTAELVPYSNQAALDIRLVGTTECRNHVGAKGPVTISSSAAGQIDVRKRVLIDVSGVQAQPATAHCTAQVEIHDIVAQNRLVERIAWRRAKRMHSEIEQAAAETSGNRTEQQLDQEMLAPLTEADKILSEKFGAAWSRKKLQDFPCKVALSSTRNSLQATLNAADGSRVSPLEQLHSQWDVFVGMHQSCFDRLCQVALAGKTIDDTTFLDVVLIATGNSPRPLWVHDRAERWSVVMSKENPVTGTFADGICSIIVRLQQVTRGAEQLDRPLEVSAKYRLEITPDGPHFIRSADLAVRFSDDGMGTDNQESFRQFIHKKFSGIFQPEIFFDGLVPPTGGSLGKLRALELQELSCRNGWLSIGYQLPPDARHVARLSQ